MFSRFTGAYQSEKTSQEQVSDKAAAGIAALAKLVQIVGKDSGTQVKPDFRVVTCHDHLATCSWACQGCTIRQNLNCPCTPRCTIPSGVAGSCAGSQGSARSCRQNEPHRSGVSRKESWQHFTCYMVI